MTRTPQEIFAHHAGALVAGDIDEIVADYTEDAVFITADAPSLNYLSLGFPYVAIVGKPFSHEALEDALAEARAKLGSAATPA